MPCWSAVLLTTVLLSGGPWSPRAWADVDADLDDQLNTSLAISQFFTASTLTLMGWVKVDGTATGTSLCYGGPTLVAHMTMFINDSELAWRYLCSRTFIRP